MTQADNATLLTITVNRVLHRVSVRTDELLVDFLRERLGLTGTHVGCRNGDCGACTVRLEGKTIKSCSVFAVRAAGKSVETIEGMAAGTALHPVQRAFVECFAFQCGFCVPGMALTIAELLEREDKAVTESTVRAAISGNLCRCTGYQNFIRAALRAAELANGEEE